MRKMMLAACLGLTFSAQAQEKTIKVINLSEDVRMEQALGEDRMSIDSVIVNGPMNGEDFATLDDCSKHGRLSGINLQGCTLKDNMLPPDAFRWKFKEEDIDDQLRYVTLPEGLEGIGDHAFYMRASLKHVDFPNSLQWIGPYAFYNCFLKDFCDLTLPEGLETVGDGAFNGCIRIRSISFPSTLRTIGKEAFVNVNAMESLALPEGLESVGRGAFSDCLSLKEVYLPEGFTAVAESMLSGGMIAQVNLPQSLEAIPDGFLESNKLTDVTLPDGLKQVGSRAFNHNPLRQVVIPPSVESIGSAAFSPYGSDKMEVKCMRTTPPAIDASAAEKTENHPFYGMGGESVLYVPFGSKTLYETAPYWRDFKNIVELSEDTGINGTKTATNKHPDLVYDLQGRQLTTSGLQARKHNAHLQTRGIFIQKGRKLIVK